MAIFTILGILCFLYFLVVVLTTRISMFSLIWVAAGIGFFLCRIFWGKWHGITKGIFLGVIGLGLILGAVTLGVVIRGASVQPREQADYLIVLGAQVRGEKPSKVLYARIMTAVDYLKENPDTKAILSGGQGSDEAISEAECMYRTMTAAGIDGSRLILEDTSTNTEENFRNSLEICGKDSSIVVVTCNFHMYRAMAIARKQGATQVTGCASSSEWYLWPHNFLREIIAVWKYKLAGQI